MVAADAETEGIEALSRLEEVETKIKMAHLNGLQPDMKTYQPQSSQSASITTLMGVALFIVQTP